MGRLRSFAFVAFAGHIFVCLKPMFCVSPGMGTLVKESKTPNFILKDSDSCIFNLYKFNPPSKYILLIFWSATCSHCLETINELVTWQKQSKILHKISIVAISLDETETETKAWEQKIKDLPEWKHIRAKEGVQSEVANDYFILATPVIILIDSKSKKITALPNTFSQLMNELP